MDGMDTTGAGSRPTAGSGSSISMMTSAPTTSDSNRACDDCNIPIELEEILPSGYKYHLCNIDELPGSTYSFNAILRVDIATEAQAKQWVEEFRQSSSCTWRILKTCPTSGKYVIFKNCYRCHHNTRAKPGANKNRKQQTKNTNCPTLFTVTVKNTVSASNKLTRSTDKHLPEFPTVVSFKYQHNHNILCADALKHRDVSKETEEKLRGLFFRKYGPTAALETLKYDLQVKHGDDYFRVAADRSICPDIQYCCRLYQKVFKENYGKGTGEDMLHSLHEMATQYNNDCETTSMVVDTTDDNQVIVAICTPLMQRVHTLEKHSGELCFMDASSNMDRHNCKVFLLLTHSCVGGLPIGVLITTSETQTTIVAALKLYKSILPPGCFGGRGTIGPQVFITDDCLAERRALNDAFPQATLLLCVFHVLQATWRWLWNASHKVQLNDRPNHLAHMKRLVFAQSSEEVESLYDSTMSDSSLQKSFKEYLKKMFERKDEWAVSYRLDIPIRGNNTNNYCESAVRVLKDKILSRTKAFNVPQLADFVSKHLQDYYQRRILDVANGRLDNVITSKHMLNPGSISKKDITQITPTDFTVVSESHPETVYSVNTVVGRCSCYVGRTGAPCKHQAAVVKFYATSSHNFVPVNDSSTRTLLYKIATGGDIPNKEWFSGLQPTTDHNTPDPADPMSSYEPGASSSDSTQDLHAVVDSLQEQATVHNLFDQRKVPQAANVTDAKAKFAGICDGILDKIDLYPDVFLPAVQAMVKQCDNILTDSHLASALHSFGKYSGAAAALRKRGAKAKKVAVKRLQLRGTTMIGVQPTAAARRQPHMGRGGSRLGSGRPCKASHTTEHGYASQTMTASLLPIPRRKRPAPHSLSHCVSKNISLGKTHSTK
ncbi:uncharacterized protein [Amphiura filiformis]|uniref:uncharacterized protein n=1 Tax=Amphiura filiformis TaxID=82378 RepID=UPI003B21C89A